MLGKTARSRRRPKRCNPQFSSSRAEAALSTSQMAETRWMHGCASSQSSRERRASVMRPWRHHGRARANPGEVWRMFLAVEGPCVTLEARRTCPVCESKGYRSRSDDAVEKTNLARTSTCPPPSRAPALGSGPRDFLLRDRSSGFFGLVEEGAELLAFELMGDGPGDEAGQSARADAAADGLSKVVGNAHRELRGGLRHGGFIPR